MIQICYLLYECCFSFFVPTFSFRTRTLLTKKDKDRKLLLIVILLCLITVASSTVTVILLMNHSKQADNQNTYPAVSIDPDAEPIDNPDSSEEPLTNPEGGGAVSLTSSNLVTAPKGDGIASIMLQKPASSPRTGAPPISCLIQYDWHFLQSFWSTLPLLRERKG